MLQQALKKTTKKRGSEYILVEYLEIMKEIRKSKQLCSLWAKYKREFDYAKEDFVK